MSEERDSGGPARAASPDPQPRPPEDDEDTGARSQYSDRPMRPYDWHSVYFVSPGLMYDETTGVYYRVGGV